jgi:hypothetical protein
MKEKLKQNAKTNFLRFQENETKKTPKEVFANAYRIYFYSTMYDYFFFFFLADYLCKFLLKYKDTILDELYNEYIDFEYASINTYSDIDDFLDLVYSESE